MVKEAWSMESLSSNAKVNALVYDYLKRNGCEKVAKKFKRLVNDDINCEKFQLEAIHQHFLVSNSVEYVPITKIFNFTEDDLNPDLIIDKIVLKILECKPKIRKIQLQNSTVNYRASKTGKLSEEFSTRITTFGEKQEILEEWKSLNLTPEEEQNALKIFQPIGNTFDLNPSKFFKIHIIGSFLSRNLELNRHWTQIIRSLVLNKLEFKFDYDLQTLCEKVPFKELFREQVRFFSPQVHSLLDRTAYYLLKNRNVTTHRLNRLLNYSDVRLLRKTMPQIYHLKYTSCKGGEEDVILKRMKKLVKKAGVHDLVALCQEIQDLSHKRFQGQIWKLILLGSYLPKNFNKIRHAQDLIQKAVKLVLPKSGNGRYTQEEDDLILEEIATNGLSKRTFGILSKKLDRYESSIRNRYNFVLHSQRTKGTWSVVESKTFIDRLFTSEDQKNLEFIDKINFYDIRKSGIPKILNRNEDKVRQHWDVYLKPILVRHHLGALNTPWKYHVLRYIIDNKIQAFQDIDFQAVQNQHPGIGAQVLSAWLGGLTVITEIDRREPLHIQATAVLKR